MKGPTAEEILNYICDPTYAAFEPVEKDDGLFMSFYLAYIRTCSDKIILTRDVDEADGAVVLDVDLSEWENDEDSSRFEKEFINPENSTLIDLCEELSDEMNSEYF